MGKKRTRFLTLSEFAVMIGVAGILASIAIPSYVRMKNNARFESLMKSVRSCQEEVPEWLRTSVANGTAGSDARINGKSVGTKVVVADENRINGQQEGGDPSLP